MEEESECEEVEEVAGGLCLLLLLGQPADHHHEDVRRTMLLIDICDVSSLVKAHRMVTVGDFVVNPPIMETARGQNSPML